jgi:hypothetical protein
MAVQVAVVVVAVLLKALVDKLHLAATAAVAASLFTTNS